MESDLHTKMNDDLSLNNVDDTNWGHSLDKFSPAKKAPVKKKTKGWFYRNLTAIIPVLVVALPVILIFLIVFYHHIFSTENPTESTDAPKDASILKANEPKKQPPQIEQPSQEPPQDIRELPETPSLDSSQESIENPRRITEVPKRPNHGEMKMLNGQLVFRFPGWDSWLGRNHPRVVHHFNGGTEETYEEQVVPRLMSGELMRIHALRLHLAKRQWENDRMAGGHGAPVATIPPVGPNGEFLNDQEIIIQQRMQSPDRRVNGRTQ